MIDDDKPSSVTCGGSSASPALLICTQAGCSGYAMICGGRKCECMQQHIGHNIQILSGMDEALSVSPVKSEADIKLQSSINGKIDGWITELETLKEEHKHHVEQQNQSQNKYEGLKKKLLDREALSSLEATGDIIARLLQDIREVKKTDNLYRVPAVQAELRLGRALKLFQEATTNVKGIWQEQKVAQKIQQANEGGTSETLEICFLIDVTGSMQRWVEACKKTIGKIIQKTQKKHPKLQLRFAVVGYRDHPMRLSKLVQDLKRVALAKREELRRSTETVGEVYLSEENYVKLLIAIQTEWEKKRHDMDAYRKGLDDVKKFVLNYHYPFIFDIDSKEDLVSFHHKLKLGNPLASLMKMFSGGKKKKKCDSDSDSDKEKTLAQHILSDIKQSLQDLEEHLTKEEDLLSWLEFSTGDKAIKFLESSAMQADGGGDPAEAVFDGMNKVTELEWSEASNSVKYVFHLFDAPPHGREYHDGGDFFPDGCPCGLRADIVISRLNDLRVNYVVFPLTNHVSKAVELFEAGGLKMKSQKIGQPDEIMVNTISILGDALEQKMMSAKSDA